MDKDIERTILLAEVLQAADEPIRQSDLAKALDCSFVTLNAASKTLKFCGLVSTELGKGTVWVGPADLDVAKFAAKLQNEWSK